MAAGAEAAQTHGGPPPGGPPLDDDLPVAAPQERSTLDELADLREEVANRSEETFWIDTPFRGLLGMRVRLLEWGVVQNYAAQAQEARRTSTVAAANAAGQLIYDACLEVLMRDRVEPGAPTRSPDPTGVPIQKPDHRLLALLKVKGVPAEAKPYHLARLLFGNDGAVDGYASELISWMRGEHRAVSGDFAEG